MANNTLTVEQLTLLLKNATYVNPFSSSRSAGDSTFGSYNYTINMAAEGIRRYVLKDSHARVSTSLDIIGLPRKDLSEKNAPIFEEGISPNVELAGMLTSCIALRYASIESSLSSNVGFTRLINDHTHIFKTGGDSHLRFVFIDSKGLPVIPSANGDIIVPYTVIILYTSDFYKDIRKAIVDIVFSKVNSLFGREVAKYPQGGSLGHSRVQLEAFKGETSIGIFTPYSSRFFRAAAGDQIEFLINNVHNYNRDSFWPLVSQDQGIINTDFLRAELEKLDPVKCYYLIGCTHQYLRSTTKDYLDRVADFSNSPRYVNRLESFYNFLLGTSVVNSAGISLRSIIEDAHTQERMLEKVGAENAEHIKGFLAWGKLQGVETLSKIWNGTKAEVQELLTTYIVRYLPSVTTTSSSSGTRTDPPF